MIAIVGLALVFAANPGAIRAGGGGTSACPATVAKDTSLRADCIGAIEITGSGLTLDCAGHAVNQTSLQAGGGDGITLGPGIHDAIVKNCVVNGFGRDFYMTSAHSNILQGNTANGAPYNGNNNQFIGFFLDGSASNTLTANSASSVFFVRNFGFFLQGSASNTLTANTANGGGASFDATGFVLFGSEANTLSKNTASGTSTGFEISGSRSNTLILNTASGGAGFILDGSASNTVEANLATNGYSGFLLYGSASNTLAGNFAGYNTHDGFSLTGSAWNTLTGNDAEFNSGAGFRDATSGNATSNTASYYWGDYCVGNGTPSVPAGLC